MKFPYCLRHLVSAAVTAVALTACVASQEGGFGQSTTVPSSVAQTMLPSGGASQDLLYVSADGKTNVYIYTYPKGKLLNTITSLNTYAAGECADFSGDVFVTTVSSSNSSTIYEYPHGSTTPVAMLSDPGIANSCAFDPTTGNLAVMNPRDFTNPYYPYGGDLAVYAGARGQPKMYYPKSPLSGFIYGAYDDAGNLYLSAGNSVHPPYMDIVRMSGGSGVFQTLNVSKKVYQPACLQWSGSYLTVTSGGNRTPLAVYRLAISGDTAKVVGTTVLASKKNKMMGQSYIQGHTIVATDYTGHGYQNIAFWAYPNGGKPQRRIKRAGGPAEQLSGVAISAGR